MTPWCDDLVCSWRRLLADRHSLPFPWTLFLHRRWCPSASHHPVTFLFLPALTVPLPCPFLSLGLSLRRPRCPSASHHSFPSHSLGRLCQRSPRTCPVSLLWSGGGRGGAPPLLLRCTAILLLPWLQRQHAAGRLLTHDKQLAALCGSLVAFQYTLGGHRGGSAWDWCTCADQSQCSGEALNCNAP